MNDILLVTLFDLKVKHQEQVFRYHQHFSFLPEISFCLTTNGDGPYGRNKLCSFLLLRRANYSPLFQLKRKILEKDVDWLYLGQLINPEYPGQIQTRKQRHGHGKLAFSVASTISTHWSPYKPCNGSSRRVNLSGQRGNKVQK